MMEAVRPGNDIYSDTWAKQYYPVTNVNVTSVESQVQATWPAVLLNSSPDKALLHKHTKFFDKTLNTETGKKGLIFLNDENPEAFRLFVDWIYRGLSPSPHLI
jgi:hypothetical protein